jgi:hypothetical protein
MVGQQVLVLFIGVRISVPEPRKIALPSRGLPRGDEAILRGHATLRRPF